MRAHGDVTQQAMMPGAEAPGFGGAMMRTRLSLTGLAVALAVPGCALPAVAADQPANGRITFGRFDPALHEQGSAPCKIIVP
jgi:hypothetical protein